MAFSSLAQIHIQFRHESSRESKNDELPVLVILLHGGHDTEYAAWLTDQKKVFFKEIGSQIHFYLKTAFDTEDHKISIRTERIILESKVLSIIHLRKEEILSETDSLVRRDQFSDIAQTYILQFLHYLEAVLK